MTVCATTSYTKLFRSLLSSSIWTQCDEATRLVWITMLAMKDRDGMVASSLPGIAHAARVSLEQAEVAIAVLEAPDKYSRTPDNDGRRIEKVPGGWKVLNHRIYQEMLSKEVRKENKRICEQERRKRLKEGKGPANALAEKEFQEAYENGDERTMDMLTNTAKPEDEDCPL